MKPLGLSLQEIRDVLELPDRLAGGNEEETDRDMTLGRLSMYTAIGEGRIDCLREELQTPSHFVDAPHQEVARSA